MNDEKELEWQILDKECVLKSSIFNIIKQKEKAQNGRYGEYLAIQAPDWVCIVAVVDGCFLLVRQYRHGEEGLTLEFPGGTAEPGEVPLQTATRELREETGYISENLVYLGSVNPNSAFFKNRVHFFYAENPTPTGVQELDDDEFINTVKIPTEQVLNEYGDGELTHAFIGTGIALYKKYKNKNGR